MTDRSILDFIRDAFTIAWKDLQVIWKDRGQLFVLFLLPLLASTLFGSVYSQMGEKESQVKFPVYLVNQDSGRYGEQVADILSQVEVLKVTTAEAPGEAEARVAEGDALAAIILPADFSQKIDAYQPGVVQVVVDPVQAQYGTIVSGIVKEVLSPVVVQGEVQYGIRSVIAEAGLLQDADPQLKLAIEAQNFAVMMTQVQEMQRNPLIAVRLQGLEKAEVQTPDNIFALTMPAFVVMFAFFIVPAMSTELLKEKREGSLRRLLAAPIQRSAVILGKMLAYLLIVCLQVLVIFGIGNIIFDMPLGVSFLGMALATLSLGLAATSLGMLVAAVSKTERQADSIGMVQAFVLAGLGGCIVIGAVPLYQSGGVLGALSNLTPHAHALMAYSDLMVKDATAVQVLPQLGLLLAFAAVFFAIAAWRFRYD